MKNRFSAKYTFKYIRKNAFSLVVLINSFALAGIIITQIYWIKEAYHLLNDQFENSVRIALKSAENQVLAYELKQLHDSSGGNAVSSDLKLPDIHDLNINILENKIYEEVTGMRLGNQYEFGIIDKQDQSVLTGKYLDSGENLINSPYQVSFSGFEDAERYTLAVFFPGQRDYIIMELLNWVAISVIFGITLIVGFPVSIYIFNRHKKISTMKSDFINNMTHEFKTPISTISLASEMLMNNNVQKDPGKIQRYTRIIFDENTRLQNHVEQILSVSLLERGQFNLKIKEFNVNDLIREIVNNFQLTVSERGGEIKTHYCTENFTIHADRSHLTNVIINLLDNANKYSPDKPLIEIGTQSSSHGIIITVEDHGIGISPENQREIFKNLYRIPTGNIYTVKGFGIGLYYVKTIIEAHGGHIILKSELNKGSRFDLFLPLISKSSE